jgi:hypothetical protein
VKSAGATRSRRRPGVLEDLSKPGRALLALAALAGAALVVTTAAIHMHLWLAGYRHVPRLGPLFLAQSVCGFALGPAIVSRHRLMLAAGALYMAASAGGLVLSATVGFVGIHDGLGVPWATTSLGVELVGLVLLVGAAAVPAVRRRDIRRRTGGCLPAPGAPSRI